MFPAKSPIARIALSPINPINTYASAISEHTRTVDSSSACLSSKAGKEGQTEVDISEYGFADIFEGEREVKLVMMICGRILHRHLNQARFEPHV